MIGFKLVERREGKLYSAFAEGEFCIEYKKDEVTKPAIGKLMVFSSLSLAKYFMRCHGEKVYAYPMEIWRCEFTPTEKEVKSIPSVYVTNTRAETVREFWESIKKYGSPHVEIPLLAAPAGTLFCDDVTLLRCMKIYESW